MTATDDLHRLLGEANIEYKVTSCHLCSSTEWECDLGNAVFYEDHTNGYTRVTIHYKDGMTHFQITSDLKPPERYVTPEQAIAATLGTEDTYTHEDVEGAFVSGYSLGLDMFDSSKSDGEKGWNQNERNLDEEMAELGWVRDTGTCHADETDTIKCWVKCKDDPSAEHVELIHVMECSACGGTYEHVNGSYEFCPRCGRRVEVDG